MQWLVRLITYLASRSPRLNTQLVAALERLGRPGEWDLNDEDVRICLGVSHSQLSAASAREFRHSSTGAIEAFAWPSMQVYGIPDATIDAQSGLIFVSNRVITQSNLGFRDSRDSAFITGATRRVQGKPEITETPIASLGRTDNFYHFMVESLPRILATRSIEPRTQFVTAQLPEAFAQAVGDLLNLNFVTRNGDVPPLKSTHVFVTTPPQLRKPSPTAVQILKDSFSFLTSRPTREKIYVSRRSATRSFSFEAELEQILLNQGFSVLNLEELDIATQIRTMSAASTVVAPHGAGLTHMLFMAAGTRVVELATNTHWHESFRNLSWLLNIDFTSIFVDEMPAEEVFREVLRRINSVDSLPTGD